MNAGKIKSGGLFKEAVTGTCVSGSECGSCCLIGHCSVSREWWEEAHRDKQETGLRGIYLGHYLSSCFINIRHPSWDYLTSFTAALLKIFFISLKVSLKLRNVLVISPFQAIVSRHIMFILRFRDRGRTVRELWRRSCSLEPGAGAATWRG